MNGVGIVLLQGWPVHVHTLVPKAGGPSRAPHPVSSSSVTNHPPGRKLEKKWFFLRASQFPRNGVGKEAKGAKFCGLCSL
jgi:hypothetical protein